MMILLHKRNKKVIFPISKKLLVRKKLYAQYWKYLVSLQLKYNNVKYTRQS